MRKTDKYCNNGKVSVGVLSADDFQADREEIRQRIQKMTLMSDVFFNNFMDGNIEGMEFVLNKIRQKF